MNTLARWYHAPAWLLGRWIATPVILLLALTMATFAGTLADVFSLSATTGVTAIMQVTLAGLPPLMAAAWWNLIGGRALSLCFRVNRMRLPHLRAQLLPALVAWAVLTVLLPAVALASHGGHWGMHLALLLGAAALGVLCIALPRIVGLLLVAACLCGGMWLARTHTLAILASRALLPWEWITAMALFALTMVTCARRLRRAMCSPHDAWLMRIDTLGDTCAQLDNLHAASTSGSAKLKGGAWQRFATALGPPWALPSVQATTLQIGVLLLLTGTCVVMGMEHWHGKPIPRIEWLLMLLPLAGAQVALMVRHRLVDAAASLALLPGLGSAAQCRQRIGLGLGRPLGLFALYVLLAVLGVAFYQQLPWSWLVWAALWTLSLLALDIVAGVHAIRSQPLPEFLLCVLCFVIALPACLSLAHSEHPGIGMLELWGVFTALVGLYGWLVWRGWRRQPHPLLAA
ncbi:MAG TPA: hypothetical protein VF269_01725 [Rhodanobacteraceae bacterium]